MAKNIHHSNPDANVAQRGRFLAWARSHPETAWEQAVKEPWKLTALRSREGKDVAAAIRAAYLGTLREAEAKLVSVPKASPAYRASQISVKAARKRYSEVETMLRPRPRRHR